MPAALRRAVTIPLAVTAEALVVGASPALLAAAGAASAGRRDGTPLRMTAFAVGYAGLELATLVSVARLRRRRAGEDAWQHLLARYLGRLHRLAAATLGIRLRMDPGSAPVPTAEPLLVLARHRGPGDSFLLAWLIVAGWRHRLHVVLTNRLRLDPIVDLAGDHLPLCFVGGLLRRRLRGRQRRAAHDRIAALARAATAGDAILLFPEGHNFFARRRVAALEHLRRLGKHRIARRAARLARLLPPRPGGAASALSARPELSVVVLGHTGLGRPGRSWWQLPLGPQVTVRAWVYRPAELPRADVDAVEGWLLDRWTDIDAWLEHRRDG